MNELLVQILDPLFDHVSREVGREVLSMDCLLNFASTCRATARKHAVLLEKQMILSDCCKIGCVYNTKCKHGAEISEFVIKKSLGKPTYYDLYVRIYRFGSKIDTIRMHCHNDSISINLWYCGVDYFTNTENEYTISSMIHIIRTIAKCKKYNKLDEPDVESCVFDTDSADIRKIFGIEDKFYPLGDYEQFIKTIEYI